MLPVEAPEQATDGWPFLTKSAILQSAAAIPPSSRMWRVQCSR